MLRAFWNWITAQVPSDEMMEAAPENEADIRRRMNELESLRAIARQRVAELQTTRSPIHRKAS